MSALKPFNRYKDPAMKHLLALALLLFPLASHAAIGDFPGKYGNLNLMISSSGKLTLNDIRNWKSYTANIRTGAESPLDFDFLRFSRDPKVQEYAQYIHSATVAGRVNSAGGIDWVIKLNIDFDGGGQPQVVVVFTATSRAERTTQTYTNWNGYTHTYPVKQVISTLYLDHIEAPTGQSSANSTVYQFALSLLAKLYPSDGITSVLSDNYYWW